MKGMVASRTSLSRIAPGALDDLSRLQSWRSLSAALVDWALVAAALWLAVGVGGLWTLPAVVTIGVCQRALGNLMHDGSHYLFAARRINDPLTRTLLGWANFQELTAYRRAHMSHHRHLGEAGQDPDLLHLDTGRTAGAIFRQALFDRALLRSNFVGQIGSPWVWGPWVLITTAAAFAFGASATFSGLVVWAIARVSVYHPITVFRELADHVGGVAESILDYSRNAPTSGLLRFVLHPHANGYHTVHHLLPMIPFYNLPEAHKLLKETEWYGAAETCSSYFGKRNSIVTSWAVEPEAPRSHA